MKSSTILKTSSSKDKEEDPIEIINSTAMPIKPAHSRLIRKLTKPKKNKTHLPTKDTTVEPPSQTKTHRHRLFKSKTPPAPALLEVTDITPSYELTHTGDLTIRGDIHPGARLTLTNCNLTVMGNIKDNVIITLIDTEPKDERKLHIHEFTINGIPIRGGIAKKRLTIHGEVGQNVMILGAHTRTDISIFKSIGHRCQITTGSGHINIGHIGQQCVIETNIGDIRSMTVDTDTRLKVVTTGLVDCWHVTGKIEISAPNGEVYLQQATGLTNLTLGHTHETTAFLNGQNLVAEAARIHEKITQLNSAHRPK